MLDQRLVCAGCGKTLNAFENQAASTCARCGTGPYCSGCNARHSENCRKPIMAKSGPLKCAECHESPRFTAWWACQKCGDETCSAKCAEAHKKNCQKPPGFTCKLCGQSFKELGDFAAHASTCLRPSEIPDDASFHCPKCNMSFVSTSEVMRHTQSCQGVPPAAERPRETVDPRAPACFKCQAPLLERDEVVWWSDNMYCSHRCAENDGAPPLHPVENEPRSKAGGAHGALDVESWFQLRKPTQTQADKMDALRVIYTNLALDIEKVCPAGADRMAALRQLKQSMHTAIGSIVTADAWQIPKGD